MENVETCYSKCGPWTAPTTTNCDLDGNANIPALFPDLWNQALHSNRIAM